MRVSLIVSLRPGPWLLIQWPLFPLFYLGGLQKDGRGCKKCPVWKKLSCVLAQIPTWETRVLAALGHPLPMNIPAGDTALRELQIEMGGTR